MSMTQNLWTVSSLAVEFNLDRRTVAQRLKVIEPIEISGRVKKYKLDDAAKAIIGQVQTGNGIVSYDEARARKIAAEAELAEIELEKERGDVLPINIINHINNEIYGNFRAKLLAIPARTAPDCFASSNVKEAKAVLRQAINDALEELSNTMVEVYDPENTEQQSGNKDNTDNS